MSIRTIQLLEDRLNKQLNRIERVKSINTDNFYPDEIAIINQAIAKAEKRIRRTDKRLNELRHEHNYHVYRYLGSPSF